MRTWQADRGWHNRRARVAFYEPILRFFEVASVGLIVGSALVLSGAPGGFLFTAVASLWRADSSESASVAGALAQVTLTIWALLVSLAGATYIEVARTVRSDARSRTELLAAGAHAANRATTVSDELAGKLEVIALDTPPLGPYFAGGGRPLEVLARHYNLVHDYWSMRSGYQTAPRHVISLAERFAARRQARRVLLWRVASGTFLMSAAVTFLCFGWQSLIWEVLVLLAGACAHLGRGILLGRGVV
jgi:hypothetical protein